MQNLINNMLDEMSNVEVVLMVLAVSFIIWALTNITIAALWSLKTPYREYEEYNPAWMDAEKWRDDG